MACHALFVQVQAGPSPMLEAAHAMGWRTTLLEEGSLARACLSNSPPDLVIVGQRLADLAPGQLVRAIKLDHACNRLPVLQLGPGPGNGALEVEPDAWLDPAQPGHLSAAAAHARTARAEALRDGGRTEVRFRFPSDPGLLDELNRLLGPWLDGCGFPDHQVQQLLLAVRELGANAIEWGHGGDRSRPVAVTCRLEQDRLRVLVRDSGAGFDPARLPHAASPSDPLAHLPIRTALRLRDGGFGILMARGLVDQLCYNEAGNEARLLKYLPAQLRH